ncbi:MAG: retroviral-like aspartic protease family protein [Burkholderiaceae bacterium]|nr:retroviral-like aspartic protease family protein [Burkholderiaceae bacterium]
MEIPVHIVNRRPIATLKLNGVDVPLLVDSGAFFSFLTPSTATELDLYLKKLPSGLSLEGYTGRIEAKLTRVEKVGLLGTELKNVEFIVGGNELGSGIKGILGRNILAIADTEYDLAHGVVRLSFPKGDCKKNNFAYWAGEAPVIVAPLETGFNRVDTAIHVDVKVNGTRDQALLDTGAPWTTLTLKYAKKSGIEEQDLIPNGRTGGAGEGFEKSWTARVARVEVAEEKINDSRLRVDDVTSKNQGMILGLDYFLSHRIYVSRLQNQMYATWNGVPIFAQGSATPSQFDNRYAALPADVPKNDADALARRGSAATSAENYAKALEDLNQACALAPDVSEYRYLRAQLHLDMRQPNLALADLDEAIRLDPAKDEARIRRASLRAGKGDKQAALDDLKKLGDTLPPSSHLRIKIADLYNALDQTQQALTQFDLWIKTHQKDSKLAAALNSRCWLRTKLNLDLKLALQDCKDAASKDKGSAAHHDSLAWTYLRLNDAAQAIEAFDDAIKIEAKPLSIYGRGLAKLKLNDTNGGEADLAKARALMPNIDERVRKYGFKLVEEAKPNEALGE